MQYERSPSSELRLLHDTRDVVLVREVGLQRDDGVRELARLFGQGLSLVVRPPVDDGDVDALASQTPHQRRAHPSRPRDDGAATLQFKHEFQYSGPAPPRRTGFRLTVCVPSP